MKKATKKDIESIKNRLLERYAEAVTELSYSSDYELLIAILLSAQCTDKRVNIITPSLFKKFPTISELADADIDEIKSLISSCSFFNNKAENMKKLALQVIQKHEGKIPHNKKDLISLGGVGQKTAHVFLIEQTGANLMAVDTHVFRVSHRLGLSSAKSTTKTEEELVALFKTELNQLHQGMVLFGRYICRAKNPLCESDCFLQESCKTTNSFKPR